MRLILQDGTQAGVLLTTKALTAAQAAGLDLVEVSPQADPPVAKIMDYGQFQYEQSRKRKEARKSHTSTALKEVQFRLKIEDHDYHTKVNRAQKFLASGHRLKVVIVSKGRERSHPEIAARLFERVAADLTEHGKVDGKPSNEGPRLSAILKPVTQE